jgi:hypothetical protein
VLSELYAAMVSMETPPPPDTTCGVRRQDKLVLPVVQVKATFPLNPLLGMTATFTLADCPLTNVREAGAAPREKSGCFEEASPQSTDAMLGPNLALPG